MVSKQGMLYNSAVKKGKRFIYTASHACLMSIITLVSSESDDVT